MIWVLLVAVFLVAAIFWHYADLIVAPAILESVNWPPMFGLEFDKVEWKSQDGARITGWWVPAVGEARHGPPAKESPSDKTIICCHGWGTNAGDVLPQTWYLAQEGFNILYFDFRGCGQSPRYGPCALGFYETQDLQSAISFLKETRPEHARQIGVYGLSMGGVVALNVAGKKPEGRDLTAVAVEAPFISFKATIGRYIKFHFGLPYFPFAFFYLAALYARTGLADHEGVSPRRSAGHFQPLHLLIIYGDKDYLAHPSDGQEIASQVRATGAVACELWLVAGADHVECFDKAPNLYREKMAAFFKKSFSASLPFVAHL